ncbi:ATP-grasp domain-containing protein (plasmid) [Deinococcus taeanensis]|uniref:ATP-grasp domain-containing protein n=1 Tax=Deinococcus taeanensis TaxID=2737050 RepID=UPI001CDC4618|nr:ATP-grasp domain-containing protein [Deinococcus taeanensis]UBV44775.1 ATP-grasp domain-containing protein [Deinococcus taeanensis]
MLLFPAEPFAGRVPDEAYADELQEAERHDLSAALLDFEALESGDVKQALRWVPAAAEPGVAVFRGWMMKPETYATLYDALKARGWHLVNTPEQYVYAHHLPRSYGDIADVTPATDWVAAATPAEVDREEVKAILESFGPQPLIVKDYVKSRKHEWDEACFIPDATDIEPAMQVIETFLSRQGEQFQGGVVLRAFEPFKALGTHSRSGMPLTQEYRLFVHDGEVISSDMYWEEGDYPEAALPLERFVEVARRVNSRLFTMDVAQREDGEWLVVELGDGQVAGLPERADRAQLYGALAHLLSKTTRSE